MNAIEAAAVRCQTMADGTLRLVVDIEPTSAQAAFRMFGSPGTAVALAALKPAHQQQGEPAAERAKGGVAAKWLGMRCAEREFQMWLASKWPEPWLNAIGRTDAERAASVVRAVCSVESRAEIDNDQKANERFQHLIRGPWIKHQASMQ